MLQMNISVADLSQKHAFIMKAMQHFGRRIYFRRQVLIHNGDDRRDSILLEMVRQHTILLEIEKEE